MQNVSTLHYIKFENRNTTSEILTYHYTMTNSANSAVQFCDHWNCGKAHSSISHSKALDSWGEWSSNVVGLHVSRGRDILLGFCVDSRVWRCWSLWRLSIWIYPPCKILYLVFRNRWVSLRMAWHLVILLTTPSTPFSLTNFAISQRCIPLDARSRDRSIVQPLVKILRSSSKTRTIF